MATQTDLMGLGMPGALATVLGNQPTTIAGIGTTQAGAAALRSMAALTTAGGATAFVIPAGTSLSRLFFLNNTSSTTALIFPPSGGNFNTGSTDASISLAQNKSMIIWRFSATQFFTLLTA